MFKHSCWFVPPVAHSGRSYRAIRTTVGRTMLSHRVASTTGGSQLIVLLGGM